MQISVWRHSRISCPVFEILVLVLPYRYQFEDVLALLSGVDDSELTRKLLQTVAWQDEDDAAGTGGGGNGSPVNMVRRMTTYLSEAMGFSCPKCLTPAIREDGCANMECQCGAHFCWACFECFGRQGHVLADPEQATYQHLLKNHGGFYPKETHVAHFHRIKRAEQLAKVLWNHRKSLRKQEEEQPGFSSLLVGEFVRLVPDYSELLPRRVAQDLGWFFACHSPSTSAQTIGVKAAARMFRIVEWKEWRETSGRGPLEAVHVGSLAHFIARYGWKDGCRFWGLSFNPTWDAFTDALKSSLRVEQWEEADK